ncbi:unnamed protein product, partial [Staurois parvus]
CALSEVLPVIGVCALSEVLPVIGVCALSEVLSVIGVCAVRGAAGDRCVVSEVPLVIGVCAVRGAAGDRCDNAYTKRQSQPGHTDITCHMTPPDTTNYYFSRPPHRIQQYYKSVETF